jgi:putative spermidine/putrescine transport system substrate-binding protein
MSGEVVMSLAWNGRIADANTKEDANLGIAWSNQVRGFDMYTIPVGAKNDKAARDFIASTIQPETNGALSKYIAYGPTVAAAADSISAETLANLPSAPQNSEGALAQDGAFWAKNSDSLNAKFSAWIAE